MRHQIEKRSFNHFGGTDRTKTRLIVQSGRIEICRRAKLKGNFNLPFQVRSVCRGTFSPGEFVTRFEETFTMLVWSRSGSGILKSGDQEFEVNTGDAFLHFPNTFHCSYPKDENWDLYYLTIDGPDQETYLKSFKLENEKVYSPGFIPNGLFEALLSTIREPSPYAVRRATVIAFNIMASIRNDFTTEFNDPVVQRAASIFHRRSNDPTLGVDVVALELGIHRSSLSRRFKHETSVSPIRYLQDIRMQNAITLIQNSSQPIRDVARDCGFSDLSYFSRLFKKLHNLSPQKYRKNYRSLTSTT